MPFFRLGGRCEERRLQPIRFLHARREPDPAHRARGSIVLPAGTHEIAAHHALDGEGLRLHHRHRSPFEVGALAEPGDVRSRHRDVVRHHVLQEVEPEEGKLGEDAPLVGDRRRKHDVEGADAIRGDDEQAIAEIVDVADFSAPPEGQLGNPALHQRGPGISDVHGSCVRSGGDGVYRKLRERRKIKSRISGDDFRPTPPPRCGARCSRLARTGSPSIRRCPSCP